MVVKYAAIFLVSTLHGEMQHISAAAMPDLETCSEFLMELGETAAENNMMIRCIPTRIITQSPVPVPRPDDLMEAYDG